MALLALTIRPELKMSMDSPLPTAALPAAGG